MLHEVTYYSPLLLFFTLSAFLLLSVSYKLTYYFFIVFLLLSKPHACHNNAEYTKYLCFFPSKTQPSVMLTQVPLLKILCFCSPAVNQWNLILAFILKKEVSFIIQPLLILSRAVLLLLPGAFSFKLVQANHSTRVTSSKI